MIGGLILLGMAVAGGTLGTWLYDGRPAGYARVATGIFVGTTLLAFAGLVAAVLLGMGPAALVVAGVVSLLPALVLSHPGPRSRILGDLEDGLAGLRQTVDRLRGGGITVGDVTKALYVALLGGLIWFVAARTFFAGPDGLYIGNVNNLGDLPYHAAITTGFAYGDNVPPQNPVFSGSGFSYHYIADFLAAIPVAAGASLLDTWFVITVLLLGALVAVLHRWTRDLTGNPVAARLMPLIVLGSGGLGWVMLIDQARKGGDGIVAAFLGTDARYTIVNDGLFRFGNAVTTLLIPQRGLLMGLGLAVIVFTLLWQQLDVRPRPAAGLSGIVGWRRMLVAGLISGLLPLVHIHTFAVVVGTAFFLGVAFTQWRDRRWPAWAVYVLAAAATGIPTLLWTARDSQASLAAFLGVEIGWDHGTNNVVLFWIANGGLFIAMLAYAYLWPRTPRLLSRKLLVYSSVFMIWFAVANVLRLAPWIWDNIKVLISWWLGGSVVVALVLASLWERRDGLGRTLAVLLLVALTGAGALDIARATVGPRTYQLWDTDGVAFAAAIRDRTPEGAVILADPTYNSPVFLSGRPVFLGYTGWLFSNGLAYSQREQDVRVMYGGAGGAEDLLRKNHIRFIVLGPQERAEVAPNEAFLAHFPVVIEVGAYRLLQVPE